MSLSTRIDANKRVKKAEKNIKPLASGKKCSKCKQNNSSFASRCVCGKKL